MLLMAYLIGFALAYAILLVKAYELQKALLATIEPGPFLFELIYFDIGFVCQVFSQPGSNAHDFSLTCFGG